METQGQYDISPEEARKLTALTFTREEWKRLLPNETYDANRTFYGAISAVVESGTILFDYVYDENGSYHGRSIIGHPKQDQ